MRHLAPLLIVSMLLVTGRVSSAQSPEQIERLAALGQVWGFLKYHHPGVASVTSTVNWDTVLVAVVPKVKAARSAGEFNAAMQSLLDAAGPVRPCAESVDSNAAASSQCQNAFPDSIRINLDLRWLTDSKLLSPEIRRHQHGRSRCRSGRLGHRDREEHGRPRDGCAQLSARTQSHAEFTTMALRTAPENKVIGSQTAGADGNVTYFQLPGGIRGLFTGLGVYYPDGRPTQRIGIVPDIEVRPTLAGIRAGRDEVLERALQYIRTGR